MHQLEYIVDLLVLCFIGVYVGIILGKILPSRRKSLQLATWIFLGAWAVVVSTAVVAVLLATFVGDPNQYIPVWLMAGSVIAYCSAAGITRGVDLRAAGYWRWNPTKPLLKS